MKSAIRQLQLLGFGQYESQAYVALLQHNPLNGYELAKTSGIPRPNIYPTLRKLEQRGAVVRLEDQGGVRYAPVASDELVQRLRSNYQDSLEAAKRALSEVSSDPGHEYIWNARGYPALMDHARALVEAAQRQLLLAVYPQEASDLSECVQRAGEKGVQVTTLCLAGCSKTCGNCHGMVYRYRAIPERLTRWLILVPDEGELLAGEIGPGEAAVAVRTRQRMFVNLASWYVRQSIMLSAIMEDIGDRLKDLLSSQTLECIDTVRPCLANTDWLEPIRKLFPEPEDVCLPDK